MPRMLPAIVAHRGDAEHFPENTLPALAAAWRRLEFAEFDVQLSADCVPFVIHDASLERTTHGTGDLRLMMSGQLDGIDAGEPARFGRRHAGTRLPRLAAVAELMADYPTARAFVEIKRASLVHHGHAHCIEWVLAALAPRARPLHRDFLRRRRLPPRARGQASCRSAGCWTGTRPRSSPGARGLQPEYVFCDHRRSPATRPLPGGPLDLGRLRGDGRGAGARPRRARRRRWWSRWRRSACRRARRADTARA